MDDLLRSIERDAEKLADDAGEVIEDVTNVTLRPVMDIAVTGKNIVVDTMTECASGFWRGLF